MKYVIIDTNVPMKAAENIFQLDIDRKCSTACLGFIKKLLSSKDIVLLDSEGDILKEYLNQLKKYSGIQDNIASTFFKWVLQNRCSDRVNVYNITKTGENTYNEFPDNPKLASFDFSDRKFVALAKAHPSHPPIYDGSDTDWWIFRQELNEEGIEVIFLCEEYMVEKAKVKE